LNFFSMMAAEVALEQFHLLRPLIDQIRNERDRLFEELGKIRGVLAVPSAANFFLLRTAGPSKDLFEALLARGILVRDVSRYPMLAEFLRISVGSHGENERLLFELRAFLETL